MSGLSTIGIISFGLALVAGRKRLPIPATGKTAFVTFLKTWTPRTFFVDPLRRARRRRACAPFQACFPRRRRRRRNRSASTPSPRPCRHGSDRLYRFVPGHAGQRSGEHEGLASKL